MYKNMMYSLVFIVLGIGISMPAFGIEFADVIYHDGTIITINDAQPRAEAVAVKNGKILAIGTSEEILIHKGEPTELINLEGRTMLPGFVDAHGHVMGGGLQALSANMLAPPDGEVKDIASLQAVLREWMENNSEIVEKVKLVVGFGYDNAQIAELRHPMRADLDEVSLDIPIVLIHQSGYIISVNSRL